MQLQVNIFYQFKPCQLNLKGFYRTHYQNHSRCRSRLMRGLEMRNKGNKTIVVVKESLPDNLTGGQLEQYINDLNLDDL